jgi:hypothetical protein
MSKAAGTITRDQALAATTMSKGKALVTRATRIHNAAETARETAVVAAAYATHAGITSGYVDQPGRGKSAVKGAITVEEFGGYFVSRQTGEGLGKARVGQLAVAGRAYVVHGVDPETDLGRTLLGGRAIKGVTKVVRDLIAKPEGEVTVHDLEDAVRREALNEARKAEERKQERANAEQTDTDKGDDDETPSRNNSENLRRAIALVAAITPGSITPAESKMVQDLQDALDVLTAEPVAQAS